MTTHGAAAETKATQAEKRAKAVRRAEDDAAYLRRQSPHACDPVKVRAALMKLHGCTGCGGRDEHKNFLCPVLSAEMADARVSR